MADLSFLDQSGTVAAIDRHYEQARTERGRLGLSQAGHSCKRWLWYQHQGVPGKEIDGRVLRLFNLGNLVEDQVIADLKAIGCSLWGQQREVFFTQDGARLVGHIDGILAGLIEAPNTPHLFECKSANKKKFDELLKVGSYRKWNETYFWQTQFYMLGLKLKRAAVFCLCKDDSRLYMERIRLDKAATIEKLQTVFEAVTSPIEPDRICPREDYYLAKFCSHAGPCWGQQVQAVSNGGAW